jgi:hypothetical protein
VVPAPLEDLGEEPFYAPAVARDGRMEKDEARLLIYKSQDHFAPPLRLKGEDRALIDEFDRFFPGTCRFVT